ncbi:MAG: ABC transporter permease [Spirochaetaceae bacterium]|jgi:simple sugar transport system permease protein|nr:ABC transporter permease [Spirochaetaceae bacterium]
MIYFTGNAFDWAGLLLCASAGFVLCRQAGLFNIGIEGQIYAGGFCASAVMLALYNHVPAPLAFFCGVIVAAACGALLAALCGLFKKFTGANELITTFLLSASVIPLFDYLIGGPLRGTDGSLLAMQKLPPELVYMSILPPSNLNASFLAPPTITYFVHFFLYRTAAGYRLRLAGSAPAFARYGGIDPERFWVGSLAVSGACAGLAGFLMVAGTDGIAHQGFPAGLGWAAVAAGLIARNKPALLFPAAIFYAALKFTTGALLPGTGLSSSVFTLITGTALLLSTFNSWERR